MLTVILQTKCIVVLGVCLQKEFDIRSIKSMFFFLCMSIGKVAAAYDIPRPAGTCFTYLSIALSVICDYV